MKFTLAEIASKIDAELDGEPSYVICGVAPLDKATATEVGFVSDKRYVAQLDNTQAGAVIVHQSHNSFSGNCLRVADPYLAFAKVSQLFYPLPSFPPEVHPRAVVATSAHIDPSAHIAAGAVIGEDVHIGANTYIGPGCVVDAASQIGAGSQLTANVCVLAGSIIGNHCILHAGCVVGDEGFGYANNQGQWEKIPQTGKVILGDYVEVGSNTTIDRGALEDTVIEEGVKLDNLIQVGHNVHIGAHTAIAASTAIAGSSKIGKQCTIAGMVGIAGHLEIADRTHVAGKSLVSKSILEPGQSVSSAWPAQEIGLWRKAVVQLRRLAKTEKT